MMTRKFKIIVIEDESGLRELFQDLLSDQFTVFSAGDGEEGLALVRKEKPDLVLLDIGLPKKDGMSVCDELRRDPVTSHISVIMVTGNLELDRRIMSFDAGADDFLAKPFSHKELLARVNAKIRRISEREGQTDGVMQCGNLELDMDRLEARIGGNVVKLSVLEFSLLRFFVENSEKVVTREKILGKVWRDSYVADRTVDTHIASLRKRLTGFNHSIGTVYGAGYILKRCLEAESRPLLNESNALEIQS